MGQYIMYNIYRVYRETFATAHWKVDGIDINIKVVVSDIRNNNRDINFRNCTNESTPRKAFQLEV